MLAKNDEERREGRTRAIKMERRRVGKWAGWQIVTRAGLRGPGGQEGPKERETRRSSAKKALSWPCVTGITESGLRWQRTFYRGNVNAIPVSAVPEPGARFRHRAPSSRK
ncbi:hypothetical protein K0M31_010037 [Melipona bicolor]|uniref:Uncharacterized protein n=1 Tax=Melipona bicolor TaxID=60889 RepID=A0AA40FMY7_9HYME|nr:hypothetical protein K0M31_010037 [Melipona bicolor]